jgi:hypothetical protein
MTRAVGISAIACATLALVASAAVAQGLPFAGVPGPYGPGAFGPVGPYGGFANAPFGGFGGYGPYGGFGGYGYGPYGGGYGPYGGYGYGRYGGGYGYGPLNYAQQLYQQQSSLTQQIFQQQQQALLGQIRDAQGRLEVPDAKKQQMFQQYLSMSDTDKADVRTALMNEYIKLDAHGREAWRRDGAAQAIIGQDLQRLDGLAQYRAMSEPDRAQFRQTMRQKYQSLSPAEQQTWRDDPIIASILGSEWWLK